MKSVVILVLLAFAGSAHGATTTAAEVSQLRRKVDRLATDLEDLRRASGDELQALRAERIELERQVRLERVRKETLERLRQQLSARAENRVASLDAWVGPASLAIDAAKAYVERTLPFQRQRRLERLDEISRLLTQGVPEPARAMRDLWRFLEQERAMGSEVALADQPVEVEGKRRLARVARLGMAVLYFKTTDGRTGYALRDSSKWTFRVADNPAVGKTIAELFERFEAGEQLGMHSLVLAGSEP